MTGEAGTTQTEALHSPNEQERIRMAAEQDASTARLQYQLGLLEAGKTDAIVVAGAVGAWGRGLVRLAGVEGMGPAIEGSLNLLVAREDENDTGGAV